MTLYKINIDNRNYGSWSVYNANTLEPIQLEDFNPIDHKLFTNDVFKFNEGKLEIIEGTCTNNIKTYKRDITQYWN